MLSYSLELILKSSQTVTLIRLPRLIIVIDLYPESAQINKKNKLKNAIYMEIRNNKRVITPRHRLIASGSGTNRTCEKLTSVSSKIVPILIEKSAFLFPVHRRPRRAAVTTARTKEDNDKIKDGSAFGSIVSSVTQTTETCVSGGGGSHVRSIKAGARKPRTHTSREIRGADLEKDPVTRSGGVSWVMHVRD